MRSRVSSDSLLFVLALTFCGPLLLLTRFVQQFHLVFQCLGFQVGLLELLSRCFEIEDFERFNL